MLQFPVKFGYKMAYLSTLVKACLIALNSDLEVLNEIGIKQVKGWLDSLSTIYLFEKLEPYMHDITRALCKLLQKLSKFQTEILNILGQCAGKAREFNQKCEAFQIDEHYYRSFIVNFRFQQPNIQQFGDILQNTQPQIVTLSFNNVIDTAFGMF